MSVIQALDPATAELWVIDIQDKLLPMISEADAVAFHATLMIDAAKAIGLPIVYTEHYPKGLGKTDADVRESIGESATRFEKTIFSACGPEEVREHVVQSGRRQIIIVGLEAHICVQQTVLELLRRGCRPFVCADAVGSRHDLDYDIALLRMQQAGAVITTVESVVYELMHDAGHPAFKQVVALIKAADDARREDH